MTTQVEVKESNIAKRDELRDKMDMFEGAMFKHPDAKFGDDACPLKHTFADGCYIREITMPKGMILTSKIHKYRHPIFIIKGECTVITDDKSVKIKAPYWGMTEPMTKRVLYIHEETVWVTVHGTKKTDLDEIEKEIILPAFEEIENKKGGKKCLSLP